MMMELLREIIVEPIGSIKQQVTGSIPTFSGMSIPPTAIRSFVPALVQHLAQLAPQDRACQIIMLQDVSHTPVNRLLVFG